MIQKVVSQRHGTQLDPGRTAGTPTEITERLLLEFPELDRDTVWRWVRDTLACVRHLGMGADPCVIERLAREHLTSIVNSPISAAPSKAAVVGPDQAGRWAGPFTGGGTSEAEPGSRRRTAGTSSGHGPVHLAIR